MDYVRTSHSKHCLMVHLIFVCKYRKQLFVKCGNLVKQFLYDISDEHNLNVVEMEVDKDHIHILVQYSPTQSILEIVRLYKQISTYRLWNSFQVEYLEKCFWKEHTFWSDGYFASSIGQVSEETIRKYIQEQG